VLFVLITLLHRDALTKPHGKAHGFRRVKMSNLGLHMYSLSGGTTNYFRGDWTVEDSKGGETERVGILRIKLKKSPEEMT